MIKSMIIVSSAMVFIFCMVNFIELNNKLKGSRVEVAIAEAFDKDTTMMKAVIDERKTNRGLYAAGAFISGVVAVCPLLITIKN